MLFFKKLYVGLLLNSNYVKLASCFKATNPGQVRGLSTNYNLNID